MVSKILITRPGAIYRTAFLRFLLTILLETIVNRMAYLPALEFYLTMKARAVDLNLLLER